MVLGIDEVGRGPWAGPLVVSATILNKPVDGLNDSKLLTKRRRESLEQTIIDNSNYGLGWVASSEIDQIGLSKALKLATARAVRQIKVPYHEIVIDGTVNFLAGTPLEQYVTTLKKADQLISSVSAASILAKVARDRYMTEIAEYYPEYGFQNNSGYGVKKHREAIERFGITPEHRLSITPLQRFRNSSPNDKHLELATSPTTKQVGDQAENTVANWLRNTGYKIIARNWRTRYCEVDIIAQKSSTLTFVEVKHRNNKQSGSGLEAITKTKINKLKFATNLYLSANRIKDVDLELIAVATSGTPPRIISVTPIY